MTFQGDVGGIGLADLLQSLARGRDGILTLLGREGLQSTVGVEGGMIHLLADPSEDPGIWRDRAAAAWAGDPGSRIDAIRMTEIARAHRIEILYRLLDADSVHFRFAPGPVPKPAEDPAISKAETGLRRTGYRREWIHCAPIAVDGLLLEYARLKDEAAGLGPAFDLSQHTVLQTLDPGLAQGELARFAAECDGASSLREIADRLGWPLRQMQIVTAVAIGRGRLRESQAVELLHLAQRELLDGRPERAASRLVGWYEFAMPGLLAEQDADFLVHEWNAGRLQPALFSLPRRVARAILRRVDSTIYDSIASAERWKEFAKETHPDPISALRVLVCSVRSGSESSMPPVRELLVAARAFNERRQPMRAAAILRIAAERQPETTGLRLELGVGLLHAGLHEEGAPWIIEACNTLVEEKQDKKAIAPLRALLECSPSNREARRILSRARAGAVRRRLTGGHAVLLAAGAVVVGLMGFVHLNMRRAEHKKLAAVAARFTDPDAALALLDEEFGGDTSASVEKLRAEIEQRRRNGELAARSAWTELFREAQAECAEGDPMLGLRKALELGPAPEAPEGAEPAPSIGDLLNQIAARCEAAQRELDAGRPDEKEQAHAEQRNRKLLTDLRAETAGHEERVEVKRFVTRLDDLLARLEARAQARADARKEFLKRDNLAKQDLLLAAARSHAKAGDHVRSLAVYEELVATDDTGKLGAVLAGEIDAERDRKDAIVRARELAKAGKHAEAKTALAKALDNAEDYLLPWKVESVPSGARASFEDGTERVTPFTLETAFGEKVAMTIVKDGCEPVAVTVEEPGDLVLYLTRAPERWWKTKGRVEALPLAVGGDHVLCDRAGTIVRMSRAGVISWSHAISSLAGIARAPALLSGQRGKMVILSEDGQAWLCDVGSGDLEGPASMGSPPVEGPAPCLDGVWARFKDGRTAVWSAGLAPEITSAGHGISGECKTPDTEMVAMAVLRRSASSASSLKSPWTGWTVEVGEQACVLRAPSAREASVSVRREGGWSYVAWEAPHAQAPLGRLWIADGLGLRSYLP